MLFRSAKEAIFSFAQVVLDPDRGKDLVVTTEPGYPVAERGARFAGAEVLQLPLLERNGFLPDLDAVDPALWRRAAVVWVNYPGLESSPYRETAGRILTGGYGGLVTFGIEGGLEAGRTFIESLGLFSHLANIGDAKSLAIHNATTTHSQLNDEELAASGVTQDTVRLSVGIEHIDDILADLDQALARAAVPIAV